MYMLAYAVIRSARCFRSEPRPLHSTVHLVVSSPALHNPGGIVLSYIPDIPRTKLECLELRVPSCAALPASEKA